MDIRDRVMGDRPNDFLHRLAGIVPGYDGYMDREKRRDADRILRTQLARQYTAQRDRLNRVQQTLLRSRHMEKIAEVDRLVGILQRFIDRVSTATYGYAGLFDPIKVEAADLDQLYTFDMALADGVDKVSSAVDAIDSAASGSAAELDPALDRLGALLDELNTRLNERANLLTSGVRLPDDQYHALVSDLAPLPSYPTAMSSGGDIGYQPPTPGTGPADIQGTPDYVGTGTDSGVGVPETPLPPESAGTPTTNLTSPGERIGGGGVQTASSPCSVDSPGAPGHSLGEGVDMSTGEPSVEPEGHGQAPISDREQS